MNPECVYRGCRRGPGPGQRRRRLPSAGSTGSPRFRHRSAAGTDRRRRPLSETGSEARRRYRGPGIL